MQQCPSCQHELTMKEQIDNPESCPACGIYFEKFLAKQAALKDAALSEEGRSGGIAGAKSAVIHARSKRAADNRAQQEARAKPTIVSIVDFDVPFWSLVRFLVKLAFAAIPAAIIVGVITVFVGTVISSYNQYTANSDRQRAIQERQDDSQQPLAAQAEKQISPEALSTCKSIERFAETAMTARQSGVAMSEVLGDLTGELATEIIIKAYGERRYGSEEFQQREITDFKNEYYLGCIQAHR